MRNILVLIVLVILFGTDAFAQKGGFRPGPGPTPCQGDTVRYYYDNDGDGYGDSNNSQCFCEENAPSCVGNTPKDYDDWVQKGGDCDDNDNTVHQTVVLYVDSDDDGYGTGLAGTYCGVPTNGNYSTNNYDCNDDDVNFWFPTNHIFYEDQDGDSYGDPNSSLSHQCTQPVGYVSNNLDDCPNTGGVYEGCTTESLNWITSKTRDINGVVTSNSKIYYDDLGKPTQSQSVDVKTGDTWASHTMYDSQGRPALQTLSAPIDTEGEEFFFRSDFIKKTNGDPFTTADFETDFLNPEPVGNHQYSLGWYYSEANTNEPYQDVTNYPYSRTIYSELNPGTALKTIGGNKISVGSAPEEWISGFTYTMPAAQELYYAFGLGYFNNGLPSSNLEVITKFNKTVSLDVHGVENVVFTDLEGKVLAAGRSRGSTKYDVLSTIGEQGYVDIHIPQGILNNDITLLGSANDYIIYDLQIEGDPISAGAMTGGHFYRIEVTTTSQDPEIFIGSDGNISTSATAKGIRYKVNYYDFALNYYDKTGRLVKTTQPLGFDDSSLNSALLNPDHTFSTIFKYNSQNQLLETTSPDEGTANFIYRPDGQIRYSQNSKQVLNNEFSYTNYDQFGRPEESGVYTGLLSFSEETALDAQITDLVGVQQEGNRITKIASDVNWNSGLSTIKTITGDGHISWSFGSSTDESILGLSTSSSNSSYNTVHYGIKAENGHAYARVFNTNQFDMGTFTSSDVFTVRRAGLSIKYEKNGTEMYTSSAASGSLVGDCSIKSYNGQFNNFEMGGNVTTPSTDAFKHTTNVSYTANTMTKNAGSNTSWDAGAVTTQRITGDGFIEFKASQTNKDLMVGLTYRTVSWTDFSGINYGIHLKNNGLIYIYESGGYVSQHGSYSTNDVFKVRRTGSLVEYLKNDQIFYASELPVPNLDLFGDFSFKETNAAINSIVVGGGTYMFTNYYNIETIGTTIKKTADYSWSSGFASLNTITGDGFMQFTAPKNTFHLMIGLSESNANHYYNTIDFAIYLNRNQRAYIYENGSFQGGAGGKFESGDIFRVERTGTLGDVKYYKNGQVIFTSSNSSTNPLMIDASFAEIGTYIEDLGLYQSNSTLNTITVDGVLNANDCKERHITVYDDPQSDYVTALTQEGINANFYPKQNFVSGNVSATYTLNPSTTKTWYSYDVYGRVEWMIQNIDGLGTKTIDYEYDPIRGHVIKVIYQKHKLQEFFAHKYDYTVAGELERVQTSTDNYSFITQAEYDYYETGALKRKELSQTNQGIDYVYNLAGQLKAINHPSLFVELDPGNDQNDIFGMHIDYYSGDYKRTNTPTPIVTTSQGENRYDGNIKATRWNIKDLDNSHATQQNAYLYSYNDQKWLEEANYGTSNNSGLVTPSSTQDYKVSNLTYDANGNLLSLNRNRTILPGENSNLMDQFSYNYNPSNNQLDHVSDGVLPSNNSNDLDSQNPNNYDYNSIGQLIGETQDGHLINYIYNASGLVTSIKKDGDAFMNIYYNDKGHRVRKEVTNNNGQLWNETYYVRDASGKTLATYEGSYTNESSFLDLKDYVMYGNSRLGTFNTYNNSAVYELTDHLGNVRAVVSSTNNSTLSATDYYPFGMVMPERDLGANLYRYKYQGQEKDPETGKEAFQLRLWDGRIGRWLTTDPYGQYASPYLGMGNNPVNGIDPDGGLFGRIRAQAYKFFHGGSINKGADGRWSWQKGVQIANEYDDYTGISIKYKNFGLEGVGKISYKSNSANIYSNVDFGFQYVKDTGAKGVSAKLITANAFSTDIDFKKGNTSFDFFGKNGEVKGDIASFNVETSSFDFKLGASYVAKDWVPFGIAFGPKASTPGILIPTDVAFTTFKGGVGRPYLESKVEVDVMKNNVKLHFGFQEEWGKTFGKIFAIGGKIGFNIQGTVEWKL